MADVILKNTSGEDVAYEGVEKVSLRSTDGESTEIFVSERLIQNQEQADWNETDETSPAYIKNKPEVFEAEDELPVVTSEDNGKVLGVIDGVWATMDTPSGGAPVQADYNQTDPSAPDYIKNRPFGEVELFAESDVTFEDWTKGLGGEIYGLSFSFPTPLSLEIGQSYNVIYDGILYTLIAKDLKDVSEQFAGQAYLGNNAIYAHFAETLFNVNLNENNTNEIFCILCEGVYGDIAEGLTHTLRIYQDGTMPEMLVDYIDEKIAGIDVGGSTEQVQADWDETNEASPAYIKNKPTISGDGGVSIQANWAQTDNTQADYIKNKPDAIEKVPFTVDCISKKTLSNFSLNQTFGVYTYVEYASFTPVIGQTYSVEWDNVVYTCTAFDGSAAIPNAIGLGNASAFGLPGNNEPFLIVLEPTYITYAPMTATTPESVHTVRVFKNLGTVARSGVADWNQYEVDGPGYIHNRPFGVNGKTITNVLSETTITFTADNPVGIVELPLELIKNLLTQNWESLKVTWDGTEYNCELKASYGGAMKTIGNIGLMEESNPIDTGEPFIVVIAEDFDGSGPALLVWSTSEALSGTTPEIYTHTMALDMPVEIIKTLDPKFLGKVPWSKITNKPFGTLSAGDILTEEDIIFMDDGATVNQSTNLLTGIYLEENCAYTVYIDNTQYYGISLGADADGETGIIIYRDASSTSSENKIGYIAKQGASQLIAINSAYANPNQTYTVKIALAQDVVKKIDPIYLPDDLGALLPVTEADNGKIIEVVDGAYRLVDAAESSIVAYIKTLLDNTN